MIDSRFYKDYVGYLKELGVKIFPHCDPMVLHDPKECEFCALPENLPLHLFRQTNDVNYTGKRNRTHICPAEHNRQLKTIEQWPRNKAYPI